ncbi:hypothetical protein BH11MYX1_BH11MYX1_45810 [soil metagenome]
MTRDIVRENMSSYLGTQARKAWSADGDLYGLELELIERYFPAAPAKIIDLGCGAGRTTLGLEARGYEVDAIDLSEDLVEEARSRVRRARISLMDARELDFADATFDAALFSFNGLDCVHPHRERSRVLESIHRVLRPGGIFYYSGHNGIAAWGPRPGDSVRKMVRRNRDMLLAQRRSFDERARYLAYPEQHGGSQILYSVLPATHLRELRGAGFTPLAVYGSRSYRTGPHVVDDRLQGLGHLARMAQISLTCPHVHYVAVRGDH